jgi:hypothetical protein
MLTRFSIELLRNFSEQLGRDLMQSVRQYNTIQGEKLREHATAGPWDNKGIWIEPVIIKHFNSSGKT